MARQNDFTDSWSVMEVMEVVGTPLKGMRICVSGHLGKPRQEIVRLIEQGGGMFHDTVKYDTTHLLTNADWTTINGKTSSKYQKAKSYGCKFISEADFFAMMSAEVGT